MTDYGEAFEKTEYLLSLDEPAQTLQILQRLNVCDNDETITSIERAGDGNMNLVMRVKTDRQSIVVKQARPWVEKYPTIAAPVDRILAEASFYDLVSSSTKVARMMPTVIAADAKLKLLVLQDLGSAADYSSLYSCDKSSETREVVFEEAASWLAHLHQTELESETTPGCQPLRILNHCHIFSIPLSDPPELDLDSVCQGLERVSGSIRNDVQLAEAFEQLGKNYLNPPDSSLSLLHGDYYPGSWLSTRDGFRVIDPEFCFLGPREFDLGVMSAHYIFCIAAAELESVRRLVSAYESSAETKVSLSLVLGFAGTEIIRRILGVAQLPILADLSQRKQWLDLGVEFVQHWHSQQPS